MLPYLPRACWSGDGAWLGQQGLQGPLGPLLGPPHCRAFGLCSPRRGLTKPPAEASVGISGGLRQRGTGSM